MSKSRLLKVFGKVEWLRRGRGELWFLGSGLAILFFYEMDLFNPSYYLLQTLKKVQIVRYYDGSKNKDSW